MGVDHKLAHPNNSAQPKSGKERRLYQKRWREQTRHSLSDLWILQDEIQLFTVNMLHPSRKGKKDSKGNSEIIGLPLPP